MLLWLFTHDCAPRNEPATHIHTILLAAGAHQQQYGPYNDYNKLHAVHLPSPKNICCESKGDLADHRSGKGRAHHSRLDRRGDLRYAIAVHIVWPIHISNHRSYDVQCEQTEGVSQKSYTSNNDDPDLER